MSRITVFDDGVCALSVERHGGTLRLYDKIPGKGAERPTVVGAMIFTRWTSRCVSISGAFGTISKRHQALVMRALEEAGFEFLYVERYHGAVAMGRKCSYGPLGECYEIDLKEKATAARRLYPPGPGGTSALRVFDESVQLPSDPS